MRSSTLLSIILLSFIFSQVLVVCSRPVLAQEGDAQFDDDLSFPELDSIDVESDGPPAVALGVLVGRWTVVFLVALAILVFISILLSGFLKALPPEHRQMEPAMVWLLLIPCFNIIWNFFVYPRISASYQSYFQSTGRTDVGDCGASIGLWYSICQAVGVIPYVNCIAGPAALILMIIYLVQLNGLKKQVQAKPGTATA